MPLTWSWPNQPSTPPGQVFCTVTGTAVTFSAGPAIGYTGIGITCPPIGTANPQPGKKLVPLRAALSPSVVSGVNQPVPWGLMKLTAQGTAAVGSPSGLGGAIFSPGIAGTTTGVAQVVGTFTVLNGTAAGTGSNTLFWQEICGCLGVGTGTNYSAPNPAVDLQGFTSVMPGETLVIGANIAVTGMAALTWLEVPLNSGA